MTHRPKSTPVVERLVVGSQYALAYGVGVPLVFLRRLGRRALGRTNEPKPGLEPPYRP